jgi:hypothetical protein
MMQLKQIEAFIRQFLLLKYGARDLHVSFPTGTLKYESV